MSSYQELPVYKSTYDLLLGIFQFTKGFSKEYKYTVGETLKKQTLDLLVLVYRANTRKDKIAVLQEAREHIEVIRLLLSGTMLFYNKTDKPTIWSALLLIWGLNS